MGFFDERILTLLKDGKPRGFTALLNEVGFSHNTLQQHLERLTTISTGAIQQHNGRIKRRQECKITEDCYQF